MTNNYLSSVLMPVFNAAPFLEACLQSLIDQTEINWELIAIDDQSTDDSLNILQQFALRENRIKVFQTSKKGIIPALKLAFDKSKGQLITRMDADDLMKPQKLERLKSMLLDNGKGHLATGLVKYFSETTLGEGYLKYEQWLNNLTLQQNNFSDIYKECVIPSPCWMTFREDLEKCGAFFSTTYPEDYDLCFRFYKNNLNVCASSEVLHLWRDHSARSSRNDPNYAKQEYFDLKLPYFLELDYDANRPFVLWGAGKKGKYLAQQLIDEQIPFHWITNNEKKWGINIYGKHLEPFHLIEQLENPQLIISVAAPDGQEEIKDYLSKQNLYANDHYFFFC